MSSESKTGLALAGAVTGIVRLERGCYRYFTDTSHTEGIAP